MSKSHSIITFNRGLICTTNDLLHWGHVAFYEEAKRHSKYLIAALNCDPCDRSYKNEPIESVSERFMKLKALKCIDEVIVFSGEKDLELLLSILDIDAYFLGQDYEGKEYTGKKILEDRGIEVYFCKRYHNLSSTNLRERVYQAESKKLAKSTKKQSDKYDKSQEDCFYGFIDYMINKSKKK